MRLGAPREPARGRLDAQAGSAVELRRLVVEPGRKPRRKRAHGSEQTLERALEQSRRVEKAVDRLARRRLEVIRRSGIVRARAYLLAHLGEKRLRGPDGPHLLQALQPAVGRERQRCLEDGVERRRRRGIVGDEVLDAALQAPRAAARAPLGAEQPAPELGRLASREMGREGAVGGIEDMVALVEDVARGQIAVVDPAKCCLHHDERVVGDHDLGAPGAAHAALDEALLIVGAGGIDALSAPVGEAEAALAADEIDEPGGKVSADHVAVARLAGPARQEAERHRLARIESRRLRRLLHVEEAEVILPSFADHHLARLLGRGGVKPVELAVELVLEVPRVGADPDRPVVLLRPQARGGQIAERLAHTCARLGEHEVGHAGLVARLEGGTQGRGVIGLLRAVLGLGSEEGRQALARLRGRDGAVARGRLGRPVLD